MKVIKIYNIHRNDCYMDTICEHCGNKKVDTSAYNDSNYVYNVVPGTYCEKCKKNSKGEIKDEKQR